MPKSRYRAVPAERQRIYMSEKGKTMGPGSRILRERAMNILRETRAKIDPALLSAMKERLSSLVPPEMLPPESHAKAATPPIKPRAQRDTVFKPEIFPDEPALSPELSANMEPVDKQKIAQIVLQYMKNREDLKKH